MANHRFSLEPDQPLAETLTEIPSGAKAFLKGGFEALARVSTEHYNVVLQAATASLHSHYIGGGPAFAAQIGLSKEDAVRLLAAASFLVMAISSRKETPHEIIEAATQASLIEKLQREAILRFCGSIKDASGLKNELDKGHVAAEVLPSLSEFGITVDLRLGFEKDKVIFSIPVAVVHLDTDSMNEEVWFQLTKAEVEKMIEDLQTALRRMENAERWAPEPSLSKR